MTYENISTTRNYSYITSFDGKCLSTVNHQSAVQFHCWDTFRSIVVYSCTVHRISLPVTPSLQASSGLGPTHQEFSCDKIPVSKSALIRPSVWDVFFFLIFRSMRKPETHSFDNVKVSVRLTRKNTRQELFCCVCAARFLQ